MGIPKSGTRENIGIYTFQNACVLNYCNIVNDVGIREGIVFTGRKRGESYNSAAVWKGLKNIAKGIGIPEETVFPHSF